MSERGVFAVDRGIWTDPDFAAEPLTEREAFLWMVGEAAWKPHRKRIGSKTYDLTRGQLAVTVRFLAVAWGWSKSRVHRFLFRLKNRDTLHIESGTLAIVISIKNYNRFQKVALPEWDSDGTDSGTVAGQSRDKLEDIKTKEDISSLRSDNRSTAKSELEAVLDPDHAKAVIDHRQRIRKPLTPYGAKRLGRKFAQCADPNAAADTMIDRGWQGFEPEWLNRPLTNGAGHGKRKISDLARDFASAASEPDFGGPLRLLPGERQHRRGSG